MKYLSLFSGIGGLDMGLEELGHECIGYSEIRKSSIDIYASHYPERVNFGDITKIDIAALPDFDIVTGGFPCQSFSLAGLRKGMNDPRGVMILHIYNILVQKKPKYFVLENVRGLLTHGKGQTYIKIHKLLANAGYKVRVLLLNAMHYGSVQHRERLVFLGSRDDFPVKKPVVVDGSKRFMDVRDIEADKSYEQKDFSELANYDLDLIGDHDRVGTLMTVTGCGNKMVAVGENFRKLSPLECERIQNFPDGWTSGAKEKDRYWALGNAVNCNMSRYLFTDYLKGLWW
jgi:DNA (cytosine-5)-methyltransferase 1